MSKTCCCVPLCGNKRGGHRFPKTAEMMKKWIVAIRRDKWKPSAHSVVCKSHDPELWHQLFHWTCGRAVRRVNSWTLNSKRSVCTIKAYHVGFSSRCRSPFHIGVNTGGTRGTRPPPRNHSAGDANVIRPPRFWPLKTWKTAKFSPKIHQYPIFSGLCPEPHWGSLQRSPDP